MLSAQELTKSYGKRCVARGVSLQVDDGEIVGLLGPNGAGKTTVFKMVAGLLRADGGTVSLGGRDLTGAPLFRRARLGLGYLPQEPTIFRGLSVADNLLGILQALGLSRTDAAQRTDELLDRFELQAVREVLGSQVSGGERRRLEMARTLAHDPKVVLLDEPFAGVDPIAVAEIKEFISQMAAAGIGVLITDHNVRETLAICARAYIISAGAILVSGTPAEVASNDIARQAYLGDDFSLA